MSKKNRTKLRNFSISSAPRMRNIGEFLIKLEKCLNNFKNFWVPPVFILRYKFGYSAITVVTFLSVIRAQGACLEGGGHK